MIFDFESACAVFIGFGRGLNEDNIIFNRRHLAEKNNGTESNIEYFSSTENSQLFAVFDGLGGEVFGEKASFLASDVFLQQFEKLDKLIVNGKEFFSLACSKAEKEITERINKEFVCSSGTTVAALFLQSDVVVACNMGDSRIYRFRDKELMLISEDHTDARILATMGIEKKPVLLQYLGIAQTEIKAEPYITKGTIKSGDVFVICSDGVSDVLNADEIYESVSKGSASYSVSQIISRVEEKRGQDNATVIVIKVK